MKIEVRGILPDDPILAELQDHEILQESAEVWVGLADGSIAIVWGFITPSILSDRAHAWCWVTPHVQHYRKALLRHSREIIADALTRYSTLYGICSGNRRWLAWLGAEFGEAVSGHPTFTIRSQNG